MEPYQTILAVIAVVVVVWILIDYLTPGCSHKWTTIDTLTKVKTEFHSLAPYTTKVYVQQCDKCGKIKHYEVR